MNTVLGCIGVGAVGRERARAPFPEGLCDDPLATDRVRASGRQHPIQDRHADSSLGLPGRETACAQDAVVQPIHVVQA